MARKTTKPASKAAKPDKAEEVPTPEQVRGALFDLLDLANLCGTSDQRPATALTALEVSTFHNVAALLRGARVTLPTESLSPTRRKELTPLQLKLGLARREFDVLCADASQSSPTDKRDRRLALMLSGALHIHLPGLASRRTCVAAIYLAREEIRRGPPKLSMEDDWLTPDAGWRTDADGVERGTTRPTIPARTSGIILSKILEATGQEGMGSSASATAGYAKRVGDYWATLQSRTVSGEERLTFLACVLGVPVSRAPWTAVMMDLLLQGRVDDSGRPAWSSAPRFASAPAAYRLASNSDKRRLVSEIFENLVRLGETRSRQTLREAERTTEAFQPLAFLLAGQASPSLTPPTRARMWSVQSVGKRDIARLHRLLEELDRRGILKDQSLANPVPDPAADLPHDFVSAWQEATANLAPPQQKKSVGRSQRRPKKK